MKLHTMISLMSGGLLIYSPTTGFQWCFYSTKDGTVIAVSRVLVSLGGGAGVGEWASPKLPFASKTENGSRACLGDRQDRRWESFVIHPLTQSAYLQKVLSFAEDVEWPPRICASSENVCKNVENLKESCISNRGARLIHGKWVIK